MARVARTIPWKNATTAVVDGGGYLVKKWRLLLSGSLALGLCACANSGAQQIGRDTYLVSARVPFSGQTGAKSDALSTAAKQCASLGKEMLLDHIDSSECALHGGCGEAEVTFLCLDKSDPRYRAAIMRKEPDQAIELKTNP